MSGNKMGSNNNGQGTFSSLGAPGQRERFGGGAKENLWLPIKQTIALAWLGVIAVIILFVDALLIGPALPFGLGCAGILVLMLWAVRQVKEYAPTSSWPVYIIIIVLPAVVWLAGGWDLILHYWPPIRLDTLPLWSKVLSLAISAATLWALWLAHYRFGYEIADPKWTPPIKARDPEGGPLMPTIELWDDEEESTLPLPRLPVREDPVILVTQSNHAKRTEAERLALDLRDFVTRGDRLGFARATWLKTGSPRLTLHPTGNSVTRGYYDKLVQYLTDAGILMVSERGTELTVSLDDALKAIKAPPTPS